MCVSRVSFVVLRLCTLERTNERTTTTTTTTSHADAVFREENGAHTRAPPRTIRVFSGATNSNKPPHRAPPRAAGAQATRAAPPTKTPLSVSRRRFRYRRSTVPISKSASTKSDEWLCRWRRATVRRGRRLRRRRRRRRPAEPWTRRRGRPQIPRVTQRRSDRDGVAPMRSASRPSAKAPAAVAVGRRRLRRRRRTQPQATVAADAIASAPRPRRRSGRHRCICSRRVPRGGCRTRTILFAPAANARGADAHTDAPKAVDRPSRRPPPSATGGAPSLTNSLTNSLTAVRRVHAFRHRNLRLLLRLRSRGPLPSLSRAAPAHVSPVPAQAQRGLAAAGLSATARCRRRSSGSPPPAREKCPNATPARLPEARAPTPPATAPAPRATAPRPIDALPAFAATAATPAANAPTPARRRARRYSRWPGARARAQPRGDGTPSATFPTPVAAAGAPLASVWCPSAASRCGSPRAAVRSPARSWRRRARAERGRLRRPRDDAAVVPATRELTAAAPARRRWRWRRRSERSSERRPTPTPPRTRTSPRAARVCTPLLVEEPLARGRGRAVARRFVAAEADALACDGGGAAGRARVDRQAVRRGDECAEQAAGEQPRAAGGFAVSAEPDRPVRRPPSRVPTSSSAPRSRPADEEDAATARELRPLFERRRGPVAADVLARQRRVEESPRPSRALRLRGDAHSLQSVDHGERRGRISDCATALVPSVASRTRMTQVRQTSMRDAAPASSASEEFGTRKAMWQPSAVQTARSPMRPRRRAHREPPELLRDSARRARLATFASESGARLARSATARAARSSRRSKARTSGAASRHWTRKNNVF